MKVKIENRQFTYHVSRSNRKSVQIKLITHGELQVAAPTYISAKELELMILSKAGWILKQSARLENLAANEINESVADGAAILYLGNTYTIKLQPAKAADVNQFNDTLIISCPVGKEVDAASVLKDWYIKTAADIFRQKTAFWAPRLGVSPKRITMRDQKTRWGSCSSKGNISYNWRVVMAPPLVIDYLVIHELCHLLEPNHSAKFWQHVETAMPSYRLQRKWLKDNGRLLSRIL